MLVPPLRHRILSEGGSGVTLECPREHLPVGPGSGARVLDVRTARDEVVQVHDPVKGPSVSDVTTCDATPWTVEGLSTTAPREISLRPPLGDSEQYTARCRPLLLRHHGRASRQCLVPDVHSKHRLYHKPWHGQVAWIRSVS